MKNTKLIPIFAKAYLEMPDRFTSYEFGNVARKHGYPHRKGLFGFYLRQVAHPSESGRIWHKTKPTRKSTQTELQVEAPNQLRQFGDTVLVKELRDRGYNVICEKTVKL